MIAKFSSSTDLYSVVKAEFVAMRLAAACGLTVAPVSDDCGGRGKDVLLIERFDRIRSRGRLAAQGNGSALTMLGL
ncbi:MAG: HipA domain-containing protein [Geminicoccaceae bacterium]